MATSKDAATELSEEEIVETVYGFAAEMMGEGKTGAEIESALTEKGLDRETAQAVVGNLNAVAAEAGSEANKQTGLKHMGMGALWGIGGAVVTAVTYSAASEGGGTYMVAWGAMVIGGLEFLYGVFKYVTAGSD